LRMRKEALPTVANGKGYTASTWRSFGKQPVGRPRERWEADVNVLAFSPYKEIVRIVSRAQPGTSDRSQFKQLKSFHLFHANTG